MTIQLLLRKHKLKCSHGPRVTLAPVDRKVKDEGSIHVTDIDLKTRATFGCKKCTKVPEVPPEYRCKQVLTRGGEIPLLLTIKAPTDAGAIVTVDDSDAAGDMNDARKDLGRFLRRKDIEGEYHDTVYGKNGKVLDPETNKGITINAWNAHASDPTYEKFMQMSDGDWDTVYKNGYWDPVASKGDSAVQNPGVLSMMVDWNFNGGLFAPGSIRTLQNTLKNDFGQELAADDKYGANTIDAINDAPDQDKLLDKLIQMREDYFDKLGKKPAYKRDLAGWLSRLRKLAQHLKGVRGEPD